MFSLNCKLHRLDTLCGGHMFTVPPQATLEGQEALKTIVQAWVAINHADTVLQNYKLHQNSWITG